MLIFYKEQFYILLPILEMEESENNEPKHFNEP